MGLHGYNAEFESPVSAARMFKASVLHLHESSPTIMPEVVKASGLVHGDGGVGSVKEFHFSDVIPFKHVKDRVDVLDKENYVCKHTVVEGGFLGIKYKSASYQVKFEAAGNGGCICKIAGEVDALDDVEYTEEDKKLAIEGTVGMYKAVEAYLVANPDAYL